MNPTTSLSEPQLPTYPQVLADSQHQMYPHHARKLLKLHLNQLNK